MKLKKLTIYCLALFCASSSLYAQSGEEVQKKRSGNPIFPGWYADPEGWCWTGSSGFILHIPLLMMNRLLWMPILRPTWCIGPSIHACFQRKTSHGCAVLCGHRLSSRPMTVIIFSSEGTTYRTTLRLAVSVWLWQTIRQVHSQSYQSRACPAHL